MSENEPKSGRDHLTENYRPDVIRKNYVPPAPIRPAGGGVEGNHVPPTTNERPSSPPPSPKKK